MASIPKAPQEPERARRDLPRDQAIEQLHEEEPYRPGQVVDLSFDDRGVKEYVVPRPNDPAADQDRRVSTVRPSVELERPEERRDRISLLPGGVTVDDRTGQELPRPNLDLAPGEYEKPPRPRDKNGMLILTPEQAAEHLLRMERMKREKEAYVQRLLRNQ